MAEIRLSKLIKQFNIGLATLVDFLNENGAEVDFNPNSKVSDTFLPLIEQRFGKDLALREAAQKTDVRLSQILEKAAEIKAKKEAEDIMTVRANKLMRQYNVGLEALISFLNEQGAGLEMLPNVKIPAYYLPAIQERFGADKTPEAKPEPTAIRQEVSIEPEAFDWDAFEALTVSGSSSQLVEETAPSSSKIRENEIIEGTVTAIGKREVIVNIGYKTEGVISATEFRYNPDLKVGDKVNIYVESAEDRKGQLVLSHRKARALQSWDRVCVAYDNGEIVKGYVKSKSKGGMIVDVFGCEAFLPGSQIDIHYVRDYDQYVSRTMDFKIVKLNQEFRNIVVSHKALQEAELESKKAELLSGMEAGQILEGTVKHIAEYGVFVDLGGIDGLIHINNLRKNNIDNPEAVSPVGKTISVVILDIDAEKQRISLGLKPITAGPAKTIKADSPKQKSVSIENFDAQSIFNSKALDLFNKDK